jgi:hypothetical protein
MSRIPATSFAEIQYRQLRVRQDYARARKTRRVRRTRQTVRPLGAPSIETIPAQEPARVGGSHDDGTHDLRVSQPAGRA